MATHKTIFCGLLLLSVLFCFAEPRTVSRDAVIQTAASQLQVRELTGHNDGLAVEAYLKAVGRKKGDAWCAAFVFWCFQRHGVAVPKSGWSPSWFTKQNTIYVRGRAHNQIPQKADVFGLWFANLKRVAHVGLVEQWGETYVITIEGNTSDANSGNATREGDGVYRKRRLTRQIYTVSSWL